MASLSIWKKNINTEITRHIFIKSLRQIHYTGWTAHTMEKEVNDAESNTKIRFSEYYNSLSVEAKARYSQKLKFDKETRHLPNPYGLVSDWQDDPSLWPDVTFGDIYTYLVDSPGIYTRASLKAFKSLQAYQWVYNTNSLLVAPVLINNKIFYFWIKSKTKTILTRLVIINQVYIRPSYINVRPIFIFIYYRSTFIIIIRCVAMA